MDFVVLKADLAAAVAPGADFAVPYSGQSQGDFAAGQPALVSAYGSTIECAVTFGATEATVTWPADADFDLPAGEPYVQLDLVGGKRLNNPTQAANQADSTNGGVADSTASDVAGIVADHNALLDSYNALVVEFNDLMGKLKTAGLMEAD